jgi:hypothetical protein
MTRTFAIAVIVELCIALSILHSEIKDFLWTHPWRHSFLVLIPTIAVPILAVLELTRRRQTSYAPRTFGSARRPIVCEIRLTTYEVDRPSTLLGSLNSKEN